MNLYYLQHINITNNSQFVAQDNTTDNKRITSKPGNNNS